VLSLGARERFATQQVADNIGRTVSYIYDSTGRLWYVTDPSNHTEIFGYDNANRMTTVKGNAAFLKMPIHQKTKPVSIPRPR
jgi:uncharacterized protein RhaS with RHS repeats